MDKELAGQISTPYIPLQNAALFEVYKLLDAQIYKSEEVMDKWTWDLLKPCIHRGREKGKEIMPVLTEGITEVMK